MNITQEDFYKFVVGQDDDDDYEESGYVAVVKDDEAAISRYGHCSCYGTWTSLCNGGVNDSHQERPEFQWTGTVHELLFMACFGSDVSMPDRKATEDDYDFDHLVGVYKQVIQWGLGELEHLVRSFGDFAEQAIVANSFNSFTLLVIADYYDEGGIDMAWLRLMVEELEKRLSE